jgi:glycosyltransferase involved in cell wall biosynthesis
MKIGIDAHAAENAGTGNCTYISHFLLALKEIDRETQYLLYAKDLTHPFYAGFHRYPNFSVRQLPVKNPYVRVPLFLAWQSLKDSVDILHVQYNSPFFFKGKLVVTIHDLGFLHIPDSFSRLENLRLRVLTKYTAKKSDRILTGSEYSKNDIIRKYGIEAEKVTVIPYGVSPLFGSDRDPKKIQKTLRKYNIPEKYFLSVGRLNPRKNLVSLAKAFNRLKKTHGLPHKLVIVGIEDYNTSQIFRSVKEINREDILFTGFVADEDLPYVYAQAQVFIYPSLFEGVGLPVLEAMRSGVPVVTSNTTSLREIVRDAAITLDPLDVEALCQAVWTLVSDDRLREDYIQKGCSRSEEFSWKTTAQRTLETYKRMLR